MSIRERVLRTGILQSTLMCQYAQTRALSGRVKEKPLDPSLSTYCTCICVVHARHNLDCGTKRSATQLDKGFGGFTLPYQGSLLCTPYSVHPSMHIMTYDAFFVLLYEWSDGYWHQELQIFSLARPTRAARMPKIKN